MKNISKTPVYSNTLQWSAHAIQDSRGRPTVEVVFRHEDIRVSGDVPAGASKGEDEAQTVSVERAIANINNVIMPMLQTAKLNLREHASIVHFENAMIERAGDNFADLGANATLPVSRALWRLGAALQEISLSHYIRAVEPELASENRVAFLMNIFNGGLHALRPGEKLGQDRIDIQEIMIVPMQVSSYQQALEVGEKIDAALKARLIETFGADKVTRADEAGFSVQGLANSSIAFGYVFDAIKRAGFVPGRDVKLALDVAASSFYQPEMRTYSFQGASLTTEQMIDYLVSLVEQYKDCVLSIEDGLAENDWDGWSKLSAEMEKRGVVTVGDDLFVTQMPRLRRGVEHRSAHAILIKVNQNGTVYGTLNVMKYARQNGMHCIVSHRSGETLDSSIADLAHATGSMGLKTGDPQPVIDFPDPTTWVRRVKYLRMIELEGAH